MDRVRARRRGRRPPRVVALVLLAATVGVGACLPAAVRPTPSPTPTPTPTASPTPTATPTPGPPTPTPAPTFALYTVDRGDTLVAIAKAFGTTARSIAFWNRDAYPGLDPEAAGYDPNRLQVGWVLRILPGQEWVTPMDEGEPPDETPPPGLNEDPDAEASDEASVEPSDEEPGETTGG